MDIIEGDWNFTDLGNGQTRIVWTYKIISKNFLARGLINLVLVKNINGSLINALTILKTDLENTDERWAAGNRGTVLKIR